MRWGWFIVFLVLASGCLEKTVTETKYVCYDGSVVTNPRGCPVATTSTVKPEVAHKFICWNGDVVDERGDCPVVTTSVRTETTSLETTIVQTTIRKTTTSTTTTVSATTTVNPCAGLGCDPNTLYVGSKNSDKYHYCDCSYAIRINEDNIVCFESADDARERGYVPCGRCNPE